MNFTIDKYQENAYNVIGQNDISIISGPKSSGKSHLIRYIARKKWENSENCLIIVPEREQGELMYKLLGAFDLSRYSVFFDGNDDTIRINIVRIKALLREEKIEISKKDLSASKLKVHSFKEKISKYYDNLNKALIQEKSFSDLLTITAFDANSYSNVHFNQIFDSGKFDFSEEEFSVISRKVKTAFELYLKGENKNDVYFSKKAYEGETADRSWKAIARWIEESRIKILKSIELLSVFMNEQVNSIFEQEWTEILTVEEDAQECLLSCNAFIIQYNDYIPKPPGLFGLDKKIKDQNEQYQLATQKIQLEYKNLLERLHSNERIKDNYVLPEGKENKIEDIKSRLETIINDLDKFEIILLNSINKELKSINFRNIRNQHTENLQAELEILFSYLSDGFAIKKWEDTAFSINKQLNYLESILEDLNEIEGQKSNFFSNYQWNSFLMEQDDRATYIIKKLNIYRPKNWLTFLKNWYIQNIILKYQKKLKPDISQLLDEFRNQTALREDLNKLKSAKIWQNKRDIYISKSEDQKNNILSRLMRKEEISEDELINNPREFLTIFTPIVIMTAEVFHKHREQAGDSFDIIVFHNCDESKEKLEEIIPEQSSSKMVFFAEDPELSAGIKNVLWKKSYQNRTAEAELKGFHQMGMIELIDMNNTERLYAARNIACLLQFSNPEIKIYHIKNKIIFSALDSVMNKVLLKLLQPHGVKEMKIIDTPYHLLVDSLLEINNKQILITQNHLLNYREPEDLIRQVYSLEKIRKAGIKIMNFNTRDLLNEPVKAIKHFVSKI